MADVTTHALQLVVSKDIPLPTLVRSLTSREGAQAKCTGLDLAAPQRNTTSAIIILNKLNFHIMFLN